MTENDLLWLPARELVELQRRREVSAREILDAHLAQIDAVNPKVNAIITLAEDRARELAARADAAAARGELLGPLHGLPVAHKDLAPTKGIRTTYGSPLYADHVPDHDALVVEQLVHAGAVTVGKTNVPEFGAGIQSTNELFGPTRNPYDLSLTAGGSSGGAAAAVATGMVALADGGDTGGSLRNPATFCNVVGLRPSVGSVPMWPAKDPFAPLSIQGPIGRTVDDVALQMAVLTRADPRSPWGLGDPSRFHAGLEEDFSDVPVAWSPDLGGQLAVDDAVRTAMDPVGEALARISRRVGVAAPDMSGADEAFRTLRGWYRALNYGDRYAANPEVFGIRVRQDIENGLATTSAGLMRAHKLRGLLFQRFVEFTREYRYLVTVTTQVLPWSAEQLWPERIGHTRSENYLDCMRSMYWFTVLGVPALSVPAGFTADGLPVGVQIVGRSGDDLGVLRLARQIERMLGAGQRRPGVALPVIGGGTDGARVTGGGTGSARVTG
ncbi:amidase family protein [Streptomyces platensis]|uniref:amidase family protein n=1 Tax=Streptomyces platensis TaxID=58346 RepID=UPI002E820350|nr:amidase family protein [Streptomyces platensis]WUB83692.1 amidase family protein [Streptomyces platensis]